MTNNEMRMFTQNTRNYSHIQTTIIFIFTSAIIVLSMYASTAYLVNTLYKNNAIMKTLQVVKLILSLLIIHSTKRTLVSYNIDNMTSNICLFTLNILNIAIITYLNGTNAVQFLYITQDLLSLILITIVVFVLDYSTKSSSYYIDNIIISFVYCLDSVLHIKFITQILQILLALKLISIYKSINYIFTNQVPHNKFYLFLTFCCMISRFIDIKYSNMLT